MANYVVKGTLISILAAIFLILYHYTPTNTALTFMPDSSSQSGQFSKSFSKNSSVIATKDRFFVKRYNITNDILRLKGYFKGSENENFTDTIAIEGISNLVNQIKPFILNDDKFQAAELKHEHFFKLNRKVEQVSCIDIFKGNASEIERVTNITATYGKIAIQPKEYIDMTKHCERFIKTRGYITDPLTEYERDFPIAFSLLMFKDVEQSERLLRAIYRPQNIYCVHVDNKTEPEVFSAMEGIANCFQNVFMASNRSDVEWGTWTVLEPELTCMEELLNRNKTWKYFINLTGQEFPLRTNYELVRILHAYNGANDIEGTVKRANKFRWESAGEPPHNITAVKGSVHIVASRGYVEYIFNDPRANDLLEWTKNTSVPDETFFATLNHNPHLGVPGAYKGEPEVRIPENPFVTRFKNWGDWLYNWPCHGQRVRMLCVFATGDLPLIASRKELFVNKIYLDYHPFVLDCLEELHFNHTRDEYLGKLTFDVRWYANLDIVKNHV